MGPIAMPILKLLVVAGILSDMALLVRIWVAVPVQWAQLVVLSDATAHMVGYLHSFPQEVL